MLTGEVGRPRFRLSFSTALMHSGNELGKFRPGMARNR